MSDEPVRYEVRSPAVLLTINLADKRNALSRGLIAALARHRGSLGCHSRVKSSNPSFNCSGVGRDGSAPEAPPATASERPRTTARPAPACLHRRQIPLGTPPLAAFAQEGHSMEVSPIGGQGGGVPSRANSPGLDSLPPLHHYDATSGQVRKWLSPIL